MTMSGRQTPSGELDYLSRTNVVSREISCRPKSSDRHAYCLDCDFRILDSRRWNSDSPFSREILNFLKISFHGYGFEPPHAMCF